MLPQVLAHPQALASYHLKPLVRQWIIQCKKIKTLPFASIVPELQNRRGGPYRVERVRTERAESQGRLQMDREERRKTTLTRCRKIREGYWGENSFRSGKISAFQLLNFIRVNLLIVFIQLTVVYVHFTFKSTYLLYFKHRTFYTE